MRAWWTVFVFLWLLTACGTTDGSSTVDRSPTTPSPSVAATPSIAPTLSEEESGLTESAGEICAGSGRVLAWVDENANGVREEAEKPLSDVHFFVGPGLYRGLLHDAWSDHRGEALLDLPGPPGPDNPDCDLPFPGLVIQAETPSGYRLTTDDQIRVEDFDEERTYAFGYVYESAASPTPRPTGRLTCTAFDLQFSDPYSNPTDIAVGSDGSVWVSTNAGHVARFTPDAGEPTLLTYAFGVADHIGRALQVAPDGTVWLATNERLSFYDGGSWQRSIALDRELLVEDIAVTGSGEIWMGNAYGDPTHFDTATGVLEPEPLREELKSADYGVEGVESSPSGSLWFFSHDGAYQLTAPPESRWIAHKEGLQQEWAGLESLEAEAAMVVSDDEVWLLGGKHFEGPSVIVRINPTTNEWITYSYSATGGAMPGGTIADFALAPDGSLWVGLWKRGVAHFLPNPDDPSRGTWLTYTTANGLGGEFINLIAVTPDGALWIGYEEGIVERCIEAP